MKRICSRIDSWESVLGHNYDYASSNPLEAIECSKNRLCVTDMDNMVHIKELIGFPVTYEQYSFIDRHYDGSIMELDEESIPHLRWLLMDYIFNSNIPLDWTGQEMDSHGFCGWHKRVRDAVEKDSRMMSVVLYADTTGLFSETECDDENMVDMSFPYWILKLWFENDPNLALATAEEMQKPLDRVTAEDWVNNVSWAGDTEGLYDFSVACGYEPKFDIETHTYVYTRDSDGFLSVKFVGSYTDCRKFCRENDWKIEDCDLMVEDNI